MEERHDGGKWLFLGLCLGALVVLLAWGFRVFPSPVVADCGAECREALDLSAQQSMAQATWVMILITAISAALSAWSLYLIRENLIEARKLTRDGERSAKAAEETVLEARRMGMAQLRAYIAVTGLECHIGDEVLCQLTFANSGQSPARDLQVEIEVTYSRRAEYPRSFFNMIVVRTWSDQPAGGHDLGSITVPGFRTSIESEGMLLHEDGVLTVRGFIRYMDIFDEWRTERFMFQGPLAAGYFGVFHPTRSPNSRLANSDDD